MIKIIIKAHDLQHHRDYSGAELTLPADRGAILDALDRARVPYGSGGYQLMQHRDSPVFISKMLGSVSYNPSLSEMNHLAERLGKLETNDWDKLDGILRIRDSYEIADVINATHNLHRFVQHPVFDDAELGNVAIESDGALLESLNDVPDVLLDCLDVKKVGALVRQQDGGVFTGAGYVMQETDGWDEIYDGKTLAGRAVILEPGDPIISLDLKKAHKPSEKPQPCVRLYCPATESDIADVVNTLGAGSLDNCELHHVTSVIPYFDEGLFYDSGYEDINALASAIRDNVGSELAKYKAVCEMEYVSDIAIAIDLTTRLREYNFEPSQSIAAFGRAAMEKTGADIKTLEQFGFDFDAYGWQVMSEQNIRYLSYGFISYPKRLELTQVMEEQEQPPTPEQTMGCM